MCGIVGYVGKSPAAEKIYNGLLRLEYRGYDSAGIACRDCGGTHIIKSAGKVSCLEDRLCKLSGNCGIGHTRWATHGAPDDKNAHPHRAGRFTIVHNGIIENYAALKEQLINNGATFESETDSEVIAMLLERNFTGNLIGTLDKVCQMLKGSYALLVICPFFDGFAVAKRKSPVILGCGGDGCYAASDLPALAGICGEVCALDDGDYALVSAQGIDIFDKNLKPAFRPYFINYAKPQKLGLDGCPHYMLKEIREVPAAVADTCAYFPPAAQKLKAFVKGANRFILSGCGTAYHAALAGARYIESFARVPCIVCLAGEFRYSDPIIYDGDVFIAVSQSGETADTVGAAELARERGARVIAVTNAPYSALTRTAGLTVPVVAGFEVCVAATKSYAGQIAALYLIARAVAGLEGLGGLEDMPEILSREIADMDICSIAEECARARETYFIGRNVDYTVALEGSLKLKEVSYVASEGYAAGELKHGALALVDGSVAAVAIICDKALADKSCNAVEQILSRGGNAVVLTNVDGVAEKFKNRAKILKLPKCESYLSPLAAGVAVQMIAYRAATLLGRDPDKPRNLAKSVTVE